MFAPRGTSYRGRCSFCALSSCVEIGIRNYANRGITLPKFDGIVEVHESVKDIPKIQGLQFET